MKMVFSSPQSPEVGLLKDLLDKAGIPCEIRDENMYSNFPGAAFHPELWILNDDDYLRASEIRDGFSRPSAEPGSPWICSVCGEESEGQFNSCWRCGAHRDAPPR